MARGNRLLSLTDDSGRERRSISTNLGWPFRHWHSCRTCGILQESSRVDLGMPCSHKSLPTYQGSIL
jgi:hypothetical protein